MDYKDPEVVKKLKEGTDDSIKYGLDCISEGDSYKKAALAFRPKGGTLITVLFQLEGWFQKFEFERICCFIWVVDLPRPEVKTIPTVVYSCLGQDTTWLTFTSEAEPSHRELHVKWDKKITQLLAEGKLKVIGFNRLVQIKPTSLLIILIAYPCAGGWRLGGYSEGI